MGKCLGLVRLGVLVLRLTARGAYNEGQSMDISKNDGMFADAAADSWNWRTNQSVMEYGAEQHDRLRIPAID